jgi:hypothetical protein
MATPPQLDSPSPAPLPSAPVLEYQSPATARPGTGHWSNPLYPLALAAACIVLGLLSPQQAGGSTHAVLAALGLVIATLWYIAARIAPDRHLHPVWRLVLVAAAMTCLLLTVVAVLHQQDYGGIINYWRGYARIPAPWQRAAWPPHLRRRQLRRMDRHPRAPQVPRPPVSHFR